jgi:hypothetical protein
LRHFNNIDHGFKIKRKDKEFLPIFSRKQDCYRFNSLIQADDHPWLIFINTNSRKGDAYQMENKSSGEVLKALTAHLGKVSKVNELESDEDSASISNDVQNFMLQNHINHITTEENNFNILGIINRFRKTLRDMNQERDFTDEGIDNIIEEYNSSKHSSINKSPNSFKKNK